MTPGPHLALLRGDTFAERFTGLGDLSTVDEIWFTVKARTSHPDANAVLQVSKTGGLLAVAGAPAPVPANGVIAIVAPPTAGIIDVTVEAEEMAKLSTRNVGYWDIQTLAGTVVKTVRRGNAQTVGDVTRSVI